MFDSVYKDKKVLVTGHTGFKGTWLCAWLRRLGAEVVGVSKDVPTRPSMFEALAMEAQIRHRVADLRDAAAVRTLFAEERADFVFHLAAQPIVSLSYADPLETISSNVMGTANVMEALRHSTHSCAAVIITSDKAYDNVEQVWGYKENDPLGGKDVYSGSKGAAELVIKSYCASFFKSSDCPVRVAVGRAGNVIGGGDWAKDRIVVDCVKAWSEGRVVEIRTPEATRPWQHVLEPLCGYLHLGARLFHDRSLHAEAFNFGPRSEQNRTVEELLHDLSRHWDFRDPAEAYKVTEHRPFHEAGLLKLNCDKALFHLKWQANLEYAETIRFTAEWYYAFYRTKEDISAKTLAQIAEYEAIGQGKGLPWTA